MLFLINNLYKRILNKQTQQFNLLFMMMDSISSCYHIILLRFLNNLQLTYFLGKLLLPQTIGLKLKVFL